MRHRRRPRPRCGRQLLSLLAAGAVGAAVTSLGYRRTVRSTARPAVPRPASPTVVEAYIVAGPRSGEWLPAEVTANQTSGLSLRLLPTWGFEGLRREVGGFPAKLTRPRRPPGPQVALEQRGWFEADYRIPGPGDPIPEPAPWQPFLYPPHLPSAAGFDAVEVSRTPRAFYIPRILSDSECDAIVAAAQPFLLRSGVTPRNASVSGAGISSVRTSYQTWLAEGTCAAADALRARTRALTDANASHLESLQVLRYEKEQRYLSHWDYFDPADYPTAATQGWNRMATLLVYLQEPEGGGETVLPRAGGALHASPRRCDLGLRVRPRKGAALLFYSMDQRGNLDSFAQHGGCPVTAGSKWVAAQWVHADWSAEKTDKGWVPRIKPRTVQRS